jgi:hypothetical protein
MSCMAATTHTMVVEFSHEVVVLFVRWLFREATTSFSLLALSPPQIIKNTMWHCMRQLMGLLTCTNVLALRRQQSAHRSMIEIELLPFLPY